MPEFWGADCLAHLNDASHGTTLAGYIINNQYAGTPHDQIVWWGRYFDHSGSSGNDHFGGDGEANALSNAVGAYNNPSSGKSWIMPIAAPYELGQGVAGPNTTRAFGVKAGNYVCDTIVSKLSSRLTMPGSNILYVYLDVENGQDISANFYDGWATAVNGYQYGGTYPFYAGVYINPNDTTDVNRVKSNGGYFQSASSEPNTGCPENCESPGPGWNVQGISGLASNIWQYGEQTRCNQCLSDPVYVDLDLTYHGIAGPYGHGQCDYMLWIPT